MENISFFPHFSFRDSINRNLFFQYLCFTFIEVNIILGTKWLQNFSRTFHILFYYMLRGYHSLESLSFQAKEKESLNNILSVSRMGCTSEKKAHKFSDCQEKFSAQQLNVSLLYLNIR